MKNRKEQLTELRSQAEFDVIVIGGGASGIGAAVEANLRGFRTLLLEKLDYTKGTSSKSTKLIHGGVRYMAQGDLKMVREALKERGYLLRNAPHLVHDQPFIIPNYRWWEGAFYTIGLKFYDMLAGKFSMGRSIHLGKKKVIAHLEGVDPKGLRGGVLYHDGQFDDSRLAMDLLHVFTNNSGIAMNYMGVTALLKDENGKLSGVIAIDSETGEEFEFRGKAILNAAGVWVDDIHRMDEPGHENTIRPSQGVHVVLKKEFLPGDHALMIPKTSDGRVLFAVPWHDHLVVGTTDTPIDHSDAEPQALEEEIDFILRTASSYLAREVTRKDVLTVFAGLRPLAAPKQGDSKTKEISRNHKIIVSVSGLITVIGGKWTTYRRMAQDMIDTAIKNGMLQASPSISSTYKLAKITDNDFRMYGSNADAIAELSKKEPGMTDRIHPDLPYTWAEVEWLAVNEQVVHLEDLLARRLRALLLNARATKEIAGTVCDRVGPVLGWDKKRCKEETATFELLADRYILN